MQLKFPFPKYSNPKIAHHSNLILNENQEHIFCFLRLTFKDKSDYEDSGTKTFDRMAFRYLGMAFFPLAVCYCIYSAIYNEHKGWYSFVLSSTYGFLLTFGEYVQV